MMWFCKLRHNFFVIFEFFREARDNLAIGQCLLKDRETAPLGCLCREYAETQKKSLSFLLPKKNSAIIKKKSVVKVNIQSNFTIFFYLQSRKIWF